MDEAEQEFRLHTAQEVAERSLVLFALCLVAHGELPRAAAIDWLKAENLWPTVSPRETSFLKDPSPSKQSVVNATWRAETLWALLWTLGKVDSLDESCSSCDPQKILRLLPRPMSSTRSFIQEARLRDASEIVEKLERIYDIHWAIRDARLNNREYPGAHHPGVVLERHFALNWITYYDDEWDEITTDT